MDLSRQEIQSLVDQLHFIPSMEYGSPLWCNQQIVLEKLSMNASASIQLGKADVVSDVIMDKLQMLVELLIIAHEWKKCRFEIKHSVLNFVLNQQECTILNLLQITLFKKEAIQKADYIPLVDVIAYWIRDFNTKNSNQKTALAAIACLCNLSHHTPIMDISLLSRILDYHELLIGLVQVLEQRKWEEKYTNLVSKTEGLIWMAICNFWTDSYVLSRQRKQSLLKLLLLFEKNKSLVTQLPFLEKIHREVLYLQMTQDASPKPRVTVLEEEKKFNFQVFEWAASLDQELALKLSEVYTMDILQLLTETQTQCANCGKKAEKRCSKCRSEWYCGRDCQLASWHQHKAFCL